MDSESQKRLADIIAAGPDAASDADVEFLRARRSYLSEEQLATFRGVLDSEPVSTPDEPSQDDSASKPAKAKPAK